MPGVIFYSGPSMLDGKPIVAIATVGTRNEKTGPLIQTWILRRDVSPIQAINSGKDASICGSCPLRGVVERTPKGSKHRTRNRFRACYVTVRNAPQQVWKAFRRGSYPHVAKLPPSLLRKLGKYALRRGSYGDPVAVPREAWAALESLLKPGKWPGYTHQWRESAAAGWQPMVMASVQSQAEAVAAQSEGWRTFRVIRTVDALAHNEILCPASPEAGNTRTCATCGACDGRRGMDDQRMNVAIVGHGGTAVLPSLLRIL